MYKVSGNTIMLTRGDTLKLKVNIVDSNGTAYIPSENDTLLFGLKREVTDEECVIEREIPTDTCVLQLNPEDTKSLEFGDYKYDISITFKDGSVNTFITSSKFKITEEIG